MKNASLKTKMIMTYGLLALFSAITGIGQLYSMKQVASRYIFITEDSMPKSMAISQMQGVFRRARGYQNLIIANGLSNEERDLNNKELRASMDEFERYSKEYLSYPLHGKEKSDLADINEYWINFKDSVNETLDAYSKHASQTALSDIVLKKSQVIDRKFNQKILNILDEENAEAKGLIEDAKNLVTNTEIFIIISIIFGSLSAQLVGYFFSKSLTKKLDTVVQGLSRSADGLAVAAQDAAKNGETLSQGSTEQAAALQETVASLDEVSAMVMKNADNAKNSRGFSDKSNESVVKGKQVVDSMIQAIDEINSSNNEIVHQMELSNQEIESIVNIISEIGNKTKIINDIVFQTKLLSFNASVEAARAGEHGKGFAVVAEEVGNLASMSGNASREISDMLRNSIAKVEQTVAETKSRVQGIVVLGREKVATGTETARLCGQVFDEIVFQVGKVAVMVGEIAVASSEQSQGVEQISQAMNQLDGVTHQNARASNESAISADKLAGQAVELRTLVKHLMTTVRGEGYDAGVPERILDQRSDAKLNKPQEKHHLASVVPIHQKFAQKKEVPEQSFREVVGGGSVPAENDPRFEDI